MRLTACVKSPHKSLTVHNNRKCNTFVSIMNEEIDDADFYHQDFTTASEWEVFTARIEQILHEWKLIQPKKNVLPSLFEGEWDLQHETVYFADVEFTISHHFIKPIDEECSQIECDDENEEEVPILEDLLYTKDFAQLKGDLKPAHSLAKLYGLKSYVVISPNKNIEIDNESKIKVLLSSIHIATNNCSCSVPVFIQIREAWQQCYMGVYVSRGIQTNFEMIHLRKGPQHCKYLTGLLDLFKTKISSPVPLEPVCVSVQFSYILSNWLSSSWTQEPPDMDFMHGESVGVDDIGKLPMGATFDPISDMILLASWQNLPENLVVDSENYSDFEPNQAPDWSVKIKTAERPVCLLSECLLEFLQLCNNQQTLNDILGDLITESNHETQNALHRITESKIPSLTTVLQKATTRRKSKSTEGPVSEELLMPILYYLFPDADPEVKHSYINTEAHSSETGILKSCARDSLIWRLGIVLAHGMHSFGGYHTVAHLWHEFVQELRFRWEKGIAVPGIAPGFPDSRTCLLHQKIQLLNCCIERKVRREANVDPTSNPDCNITDDESDEEEFFECNTTGEQYSLWNQPVGRLKRFGSLLLLKTGEPLYVPITQEPVPKTEEQLEEDATVLLQLGDDNVGAELRARIMSASLLSDMEAFKAANPHALLEDFIRWYSPRDWIEVTDDSVDDWGQRLGHLSSRMQIADNMWIDVWESAKPVPARRQKRLFDDTVEAERTLRYLEMQTMAQVAHLILPSLIHAAIYRLVNESQNIPADFIPTLPASMKRVLRTAERITRDTQLVKITHQFEVIISGELSAIEIAIAQVQSLKRKFDPSNTNDENLVLFMSKLLEGSEATVIDGPNGTLGHRITTMFAEAQKATQLLPDSDIESDLWANTGPTIFPEPSCREFIMRVMAKKPTVNSASLPQFLHAVLSRDEFRLAGAFSQDTIFF